MYFFITMFRSFSFAIVDILLIMRYAGHAEMNRHIITMRDTSLRKYCNAEILKFIFS